MNYLLPKLELSGPECQSLLEAIVDCEPSLYERIKAIADKWEQNKNVYKVVIDYMKSNHYKSHIRHSLSSWLFTGQTYFDHCGCEVTIPENCIAFEYEYEDEGERWFICWNYVEKKVIVP